MYYIYYDICIMIINLYYIMIIKNLKAKNLKLISFILIILY